MTDHDFTIKISLLRGRSILLLFLLLVLCGCQAGEPPLTPAAASFKKEVQECIARVSKGLVEPLVKKDVAAINETLKHIEPEALKLCRMCPFRIGVLDQNGDTLTVYPARTNDTLNFSTYDVVVQTLKNRKINQQRLYLQDGYQIYIICVPISRGDDLVGIMALSLSAAEAKGRWGLNEKEFLTIDFNRKS